MNTEKVYFTKRSISYSVNGAEFPSSREIFQRRAS